MGLSTGAKLFLLNPNADMAQGLRNGAKKGEDIYRHRLQTSHLNPTRHSVHHG